MKRLKAELRELEEGGVTPQERRRMWIVVFAVAPPVSFATIWYLQRFGEDPKMLALFFGLTCLILGLTLRVIVLALKLLLRQR